MILNKFDRFLRTRQSLIDQYKKGDFTKEEFIEANFDCVQALDIKPFQKIDNMKKGIYNYQYFNVMAKYYQKLSQNFSRDYALKQEYTELSNYYYSRKDRTTEKMLKLVDFMGLEAYYVRVNSPNLKKKLIEIVFTEYDNIILHTKSEVILKLLKSENAFCPEERKSVIDNYVNQKF